LLHRLSGGRATAFACATSLLLAGSAPAAFGQTTVSAPWVSQDIGSPAIAGKAIGARGNFTITAAGADVWGTSDQFHFVYLRVSGDVDVRARVASVSAAHAWSKAGVMIRATLDAASPHAFMLASAGKGLAFQRRVASGGVSTNTAGPAAVPPQWVRLVRAGSLVTAYISPDGIRWTAIARDSISLGTTAYVGVAVTAHNEFKATTAVVSNVTVLPSGQTAADIGAPALVGNANFGSGVYTLAAAGRDIWDAADQFHFVFQPAVGDVDVSAHVSSIGYADQWSKAGVMIRETLTGGSRQAFALASAGRGYAFQRRVATNGVSEHTAGPASPPPGWVRLTRVGSLFTAYVSADGKTWQVVGSDTIPMASAVYVGIAATSHNPDAYSTSRVDRFSVTSPATPPSGSDAPTGVAFEEAPDQTALISGYRLDVFSGTANPATATPVSSIAVGKPAPDASGVITVLVPAFFSALQAGSYQLTVVAVGPGGIGRSAPVPFTR
jgi:regulation of enolase protein 1 (concanavalin A-like superfamily)